ncbi:type II secretion system F family protein [Microvirga roseola]|uniref:type II secretion system F family protein n=1 Tax=Microvirga roseola TaxID=2883126 RepID=UPI001E3878BB|nr:type II secretion system F family protein [Microvirga roseola]
MLPADAFPVIVGLLAALSAGGILSCLFPSPYFQKSKGVRRLEVIATPGTTIEHRTGSDESKRKRMIEATLRELEEKQRIRQGAKPTLKVRMRQAGLTWSRRTYYGACAAAGAVTFLLAMGGGGIGPLSALGFGAAGALLFPHLYVSFIRKRRFKAFGSEFPNAVDIIVRGVKSGLPLVDCMRIISLEAQEPVRSEFRAILEDQTMGMPVDQAVQRLPERVPLAETNFFAIVIALQSRTGGSLSETLANLSKVIRDRKKMQAKIKAVSSEAKSSAAIIGSLPVVVAVLLYLTSPEYIMLLFTTFIGNFVVIACALWMGIGILVMRKMINFDF